MSNGEPIYASVTYKGGVKYEGNITPDPEMSVGDQSGGANTKAAFLKKMVTNYETKLNKMQKTDELYAATELLLNGYKKQLTEMERSINDMQSLAAQQQPSDAQQEQPAIDVLKAATPTDPQADMQTIVNDPVPSVTQGTTNEDQQLLTNDTNKNTAAEAGPLLVTTPTGSDIKSDKPPAKNITLNATCDGKTYSGTLIHKTTLKERASNLTQLANASAKNIYANTTGALSSAASSAKGALVNAKDAAVNAKGAVVDKTRKLANALKNPIGESSGGKTRNKRRRPRRRVTYKYKTKPKPKSK